MKKYFVISAMILVIWFVFIPGITQAQEQERVAISVFVRDDCAHCQDEKEFLANLQKEFPQITLHYYNVDEPNVRDLFNVITDKYSLVKGTPITLVSCQIIQGFDNRAGAGEIIKNIVKQGQSTNKLFEDITGGCAKVVDGFTGADVCNDQGVCSIKNSGFFIKIPIIGKVINAGNLPLATLSLVLGFVDGFNPCALWVLVMFLIILSQLGSRRRMFQYAGLFIVAEAIMYYLILNVWLTAWNFVGLNRYAIPLVAVLAIGSGIYFLYKFATFKPVCAVAGAEQRKKISARVKDLASNPLTLGVALGILGLAFSVNIFEFACSIGIPQTFTKILDLNALAWLTRQGYMLLYILMYMMDDVIVFAIALYSIDKIGITQKYSKWSSLVGGILMIILGIIFLVKPTLLIF